MLKATVVKRNGDKVTYDEDKIKTAITKANNSVGNKISEEQIKKLIEMIESGIQNMLCHKEDISINVEEIQDIIENHLMLEGYPEVAKSYILYRKKHEEQRQASQKLMQQYQELLFTDAEESDSKRDNANINTDAPMGIMLKLGAEGAKCYADYYALPEEFAKADKEKFIHIHDKDFSMITLNCLQIDLLKTLHEGFSTGHGHLREPNSIRSYGALAAILLQSSQNDMFGGQSLNGFDYAMAEGVKKSFRKTLLKEISKAMKYKQYLQGLKRTFIAEKIDFNKCHYSEDSEEITKIIEYFAESIHIEKVLAKDIFTTTCDEVREETFQAMEALIHNLNSLHSRAGSQTPFSSINFGMDTSEEGRLVSRKLLEATWNGLGHGETPIFPISIFQLKSGVNYNPEDKNYDLFKLALKVSAKRLFPNFLSLDSTYNLPYYKKDDYNSYVTAMGCAAGEELITYAYKGKFYTDGLQTLWNKMDEETRRQGISEYKIPFRLSVWSENNGRFVDVFKVIKNPDQHNWYRVSIENGRSLILTEDHPLYTHNRGRVAVKDLKPGDTIETYFNLPAISYENGTAYGTPEHYYMRGLELAKTKYLLTFDYEVSSEKIVKKIQNNLEKFYGYKFEVTKNEESDSYQFINKENKRRFVPSEIFNAPRYVKLAYLAGFIDGGGGISKKGTLHFNSVEDKEFALQQVALIQSLGYPAMLENVYDNDEKFSNGNLGYYSVSAKHAGNEIAKYRCDPEEDYLFFKYHDKLMTKDDFCTTKISKITLVESLGFLNKDSYDLETATDKFTLSFVNSGNCRTRVMSNVNGLEESGSRGNFAFVTINLPQIALEAKKSENFMNEFWKIYDRYIKLSKEYLEYRFEIIAQKKVKNFPFIMGQKLYMGSENLKPDDEIRSAIKNASLSIGFCGLAECLVALIGKHHGESNEAQELGLKIVGHLREMTDKFTKETHMNWSTFASPAESTAGAFLRATRKHYGVIKGVTDKEYFTNSSHVPVYYPISAIEKIKIEAPYHTLCNAGQIGYIEMDGDPLKNLEAFETIIRAFHDNNCGYFSINHAVDRDPVCGYTGIIENECPHCHRKEKEKKHLRLKLRVEK